MQEWFRTYPGAAGASLVLGIFIGAGVFVPPFLWLMSKWWKIWL